MILSIFAKTRLSGLFLFVIASSPSFAASNRCDRVLQNVAAISHNAIKRGMDLALIAASTPVVLPISMLAALAIKFDSSGPVIFVQTRTGKNGTPFRLYKFRSMTIESERNGAQRTVADDPRVTRVGKVIRKYRIDELPQFWNVLKGDMSLVGPRPEQTSLVEHLRIEIPFYDDRHQARPGITGYAQIQPQAVHLSPPEVLKFDLYCLENPSIGLDLKILLKTVGVILRGEGH